jgi:hypothetical protein
MCLREAPAPSATTTEYQTRCPEAADTWLIDTAPAHEIAKLMNRDKASVEAVLEEFKELFRKSEKTYSIDPISKQPSYDYALVLRYSRRLYKNYCPVAQQTKLGKVWSRPLNHEELFGLLGFIADRVRDEQQRQRTAQSNQTVLVVALLAAFASMASALISLFK